MARRGKTLGGPPRLSRKATLLLAVVALVALGIGAILFSRHWAPSRDRYPLQGVSVSGANGTIRWTAVTAQGADFAYIRAVDGARRDPFFSDNWSGARNAGLRYGAVHAYSLCAPGEDQATAFLTTVPRDNAALPPAVRLDFSESCKVRPSRTRLLKALDAFLEAVEAHTGKPALIRVSHAFEEEYRIGAAINRTFWLEGDFLPPDYAGHPWVMWTANASRRLEGLDEPVEWNVVRHAPDA